MRRSLRAKKLRVIVTPDKIEVVAPNNTSEKQVRDFVKEHKDWIERTYSKVKDQKKAIKKTVPESYKDGILIPFRGGPCKLNVSKTSSACETQVVYKKGEFNVVIPDLLSNKNDESEWVHQALIIWMKQQAYKDVWEIVEEYGQKKNLYPNAIRIKTQKSRWGSCSAKRNININWLLMLAPKAVLTYVVIHEICHLKEMNHSARFWDLVGEHYPLYQQQRDWLKKNGSSLMAFIG
ncbi:MAG: M48 family metallopeptidase [Methylococcales bacterium]|nr:M48 family metallopeptidase [Methylococcales bacterium]